MSIFSRYKKPAKKNALAKNYFFNVAYKILNIIIPLITAPYLSRTIGAEGIGTYAFYYSIAHYFYIFGKMGLNNYGAREIAMVKNDKAKKDYMFSSIYYQQVLVVSITLLLYATFCIINLKDGIIIPAILGFYTIGCLFDIDWLYAGGEKFTVLATKNIIVKVISLIAIFLLVKGPDDLLIYVLIMSLSMFIGFITLWFGIRKEVAFTKVKFRDIVKHIKPSAILLLPVLAESVYNYTDKIMVGDIAGMGELGLYDNAEKIICAITGFITAFTTIMMPRCSNLVANNKSDRCQKYIKYSMDFLFFIILLMGGVCYGVANIVVPLAFGPTFVGSITLLRLLIFTLPFIVWSMVIRSMWVIPNKKDKVFTCTLVVSAALNFVLNMVLIPSYGAAGACIGTIVAEMFVPVMQYLFIRKEIAYATIVKNALLFICAFAITASTISMLSSTFPVEGFSSLFVLLAAGTLIYMVAVIVLFAIFRRKDTVGTIRYLRDKLTNKRVED